MGTRDGWWEVQGVGREVEEIKMKYTYKYIYQENLDETGVFLFYSELTSYLLIPKPFSHLILWLCKCIFLEV